MRLGMSGVLQDDCVPALDDVDAIDEGNTILLNVDRPATFVAAVRLACDDASTSAVGLVGWDNGAPICDSCSPTNRRGCDHAKALRCFTEGAQGMRVLSQLLV